MRKNATTYASELTLSTYITTSVVIKSTVVKVDGTSPLFLAIRQGKERRSLSLQQYWPVQYFDKAAQALLPRKKKDIEWIDQDIILNAAKAKVSRIINDHRVKNIELSIDDFVDLYKNYASRESLLFYMDKKNDHLYAEGINSYRTKVRHSTTFTLIKRFSNDKLMMHEVNLEWVRKFDAWMRKQQFSHNYIVTNHKTLRTYLNFAIEDNHRIDYPYAKFPLKFADGIRAVLSIQEVQKLHLLMDSPIIGPTERETLIKFLFSCYTGLRISDSNIISSDNIVDGILIYKPMKGRKFGREIRMKVPDVALKLIEHRSGRLFNEFDEATVNRSLKIIAGLAQINKKFTFRVSRDTFATIFITLGGDIASLKDLMGHESIQTTMIYIKMSTERKNNLMSNFDTMFTKNEELVNT